MLMYKYHHLLYNFQGTLINKYNYFLNNIYMFFGYNLHSMYYLPLRISYHLDIQLHIYLLFQKDFFCKNDILLAQILMNNLKHIHEQFLLHNNFLHILLYIYDQIHRNIVKAHIYLYKNILQCQDQILQIYLQDIFQDIYY